MIILTCEISLFESYCWIASMNVVIILLASFPFFIDELLLVLVWSLRPQHFRLTGAIPCINRDTQPHLRLMHNNSETTSYCRQSSCARYDCSAVCGSLKIFMNAPFLALSHNTPPAIRRPCAIAPHQHQATIP